MQGKATIAACYLSMLMALAGPVTANELPLDFRLSLDSLSRDQSELEGTIGLSLLYRFDNGVYTGVSVYSAAIGDAGGFFAGGYEIGKRFSLGKQIQFDAEMFVGGGGGAGQVNGDGLMLRPSMSLVYQFDTFDLLAGVAWLDISGSEISTTAITVGWQTHLGQSAELKRYSEEAFNPALRVASLKALYKTVNTNGSIKADGQPLSDIQLVGSELEIRRGESMSYFIQAAGVVGGDAEGYAEWMLGMRGSYSMGFGHIFADLEAGIGGGGAVDTGGGFIAGASAGIEFPIGETLSLEAGIGYVSSPGGDFSGMTPTVKLSKHFTSWQDNANAADISSNWRLGTGISYLADNDQLRKPVTENTGAPGLLSAHIDYFTGPNAFITGQAYTAYAGQAGGFQMGLLGVGYQAPISGKLALSGELLLGAGGGATIDTGGGALAAANLEIEIPIAENIGFSLGAGWLKALRNRGLDGPMFSAAIEFRFSTLR